ncbi:unnamed protein product [Arctogadus glacialis]
MNQGPSSNEGRRAGPSWHASPSPRIAMAVETDREDQDQSLGVLIIRQTPVPHHPLPPSLIPVSTLQGKVH